jgi:cytochrome P450 family 150 subfamily A5
MSDFDTVDFFRDESVVADPYPYFDHLRSTCPVWREAHHDVVMVTGYEEACAVYQDPETFSSANSVTGPFPGFAEPLVGDDVSEQIEAQRDRLPFSDQLPTFDPPKHREHRALLMRLLTPARLRENEEAMWQLADRQLDGFVKTGKCELVRDFAGPFTLLVIADLLGVPEEDRPEFADELQGNKRRRNQVGGTGDEHLEHSPLGFLYARIGRYVEDRRANPRKDVMTGMATARFPDGTLPSVEDVTRLAANLFGAGQETTVRMLAAALQLLAERPELQQRLRDERALIPDFVEEILRHESPVKGDFRVTRVATMIGDVKVPAGTTVMVLNGAANRDGRKFEDPAEFVLERGNSRQHLAFGRGVHTCPGVPLARAEGRISLDRILDRMGDIRIDEDKHGPAGARRYAYAPTFILRGLNRLHLEFTPMS